MVAPTRSRESRVVKQRFPPRHWHGVATRYGNPVLTYHGAVILRPITIWLKPWGYTLSSASIRLSLT